MHGSCGIYWYKASSRLEAGQLEADERMVNIKNFTEQTAAGNAKLFFSP